MPNGKQKAKNWCEEREMSLRKPTKRDLAVGKIVDIYDGEGNLKGKAKLIKRQPSRTQTEGLPYIRYEKHNDVQQPSCYFWSQERWLVEWVSHPYYRVGDRIHTMVHYFMTMQTDLDSRYDITKEGNKGGEVEGLYVFLEETILELDESGGYTPETIKALKRVMRAGNGALVVYGHSPLIIKERFELSKLPFRIMDFLPPDMSFQEGIEWYLEDVDCEEYLIFTGPSQITLPNTIRCPQGLKLKNTK